MNNGNKYRERLLLLAFSLSGGAALIYEVVWFKVLSLVIGSTVYAISTMLAAFMGGLSLGAYLAGRRADSIKEPVLALGFIELGIGLTGIFTLVLIGYIQPVYALLFLKFKLSFSFFSATQFVLCFLIMMLPTTLMGATFPVICKALVRGTNDVGKDTGYAYSFNTIGAIAGSMSAGFLLIPYMGLKGANIVAASINILTALALIGYAKRWGSGRALAAFFAAVAVLFIAKPALYAFEFVYPLNYYMAGRFEGSGINPWDFKPQWEGGKSLLFNRENAYGVVQVFSVDSTGQKFLMNNGKIEGGMGGDINNQLLLALLPLAVIPDAGSFLNIGLGTGMTLNAALESEIPDVTCVEVNPAVVEAVGEHFYPAMLDNPGRPELILADARNYLSMNDARYDIISSEPSYPTDDSVSHLFTKEFFELVKSRLNENGVFCQWIPFHILGNKGVTVMMKTFAEAFPNSYYYNIFSKEGSPYGADILMLGVNSDVRLAYDEIKERVPLMMLVGGEEAFKPALKGDQFERMMASKRIPINTDNRPVIEFMAAKGMMRGYDRL